MRKIPRQAKWYGVVKMHRQRILLELNMEESYRDHGGERKRSKSHKVYLNVYDMVWVNDYTSPLGIGAFHSGTEVHGREYAYGGHPYSYTGVYDTDPKQAAEVAGEGLRFKQTLVVGTTVMSSEEVREVIQRLGKQYNGNAYHILNKNCNHFSSELCRVLCGVEIPAWINRLAYVSSWMPFIVKCLPPSWVAPPLEEDTPTATPLLYSYCPSKSQSRAQHVHEDSDN